MCVLEDLPERLPDLGECRRVSVALDNSGSTPTLFTHWVWDDPAWLLLAQDNYFWLDPGEKRILTLTFAPAGSVASWDYPAEWLHDLLKNLHVKAWNSIGE
jgi:hypothetical protein